MSPRPVHRPCATAPPRPQPVRLRSAAWVVLVLFAVGALAGCMNEGQSATFDALNADRTAHGLPALREDPYATQKAQAWALHLARAGALSHSDLAAVFTGINWCVLGENVGLGGSSAIVERAYMGSAGHRRNILDPKWDSVGIGFRQAGATTYTVQVFVELC